MIRIGITGTDTGVGKTVVTCALAAALHDRGLRVAAMKPVETGVRADDARRDGARIARAARSPHPLAATAPLVFPDPVAPLLAARLAGGAVDLAALDASMSNLSMDAGALLVEGAGGLLVPITRTLDFGGLFARWELDIVIVAANRLGVINHTRLSVQVAQAAGLRVAAVVLNEAAPAPPDPSAADNLSLLRELLPDVPVVPLPRLADTDDLALLADAAERSALAELVAPEPAAPTFLRRK